jgi:hypothetical protein
MILSCLDDTFAFSLFFSTPFANVFGNGDLEWPDVIFGTVLCIYGKENPKIASDVVKRRKKVIILTRVPSPICEWVQRKLALA